MHREQAERSLIDILGRSRVSCERPALAEAERATFETSQSIWAIVTPADREQVRQVLVLANQAGFKVYPVSSGKNWGYGSRVPVTGPSILLDLRDLNRIVDFNEKLAYVTVEPGVTQQQLYEFLESKQADVWMDATGSSPHCSLIGNAMERGFGHTPYGDHFSQVCGMEVMLPSGDVIETGFAGLPAAQTGPVYKWGIGPSLDGLFSQSNLGIVTRMTVWLMPRPQYFQAFFFQCPPEGIRDVIDALRPLRMDGTLRSAVHIGNDYKVLAGIQQFPKGEAVPLGRDRMNKIGKKAGIAGWSGSGALYGTVGQVREARRLVRAALAGKVDRVRFLDDKLLRVVSKFRKPYRLFTGLDLSKTLDLLKPVYGLLKGRPTDQSLGSAYWRKPMPIPADKNPDRDGCGLLWCAPVAPLDGEHARKLSELTEELLLRHGFEPLISLTLLTERCLSAVVSITYDRDVQGEDEKAMRCFRDLSATLTQEGYYPYRLGIASMDLQGSRGAYSRFLSDLKRTVDPNSVLSPGRYIASESEKMGTAA